VTALEPLTQRREGGIDAHGGLMLIEHMFDVKRALALGKGQA
jgi:hypothetical protein